MTPAQARALLGDSDDRAHRKRGREKPPRGEGWTRIRNQDDLIAALARQPATEN